MHFKVSLPGFQKGARFSISELKQVTFLTTRTSTGSKVDVFHQSQPLTQSSDVTHAVRVVKNVTCLSSLLSYYLHYSMSDDVSCGNN
jgi:hypothetical protein